MKMKFKAFYQKMMDDLKDADMLIDYAKCLHKEGEQEMADYLMTSARYRLENSYPDSRKWFIYVCDKDNTELGECLKDAFVEEFDEWRERSMNHIMKHMKHEEHQPQVQTQQM